jgi:hypothetical protein
LALGSWPNNFTLKVSAALKPEYIVRHSYHPFLNPSKKLEHRV